MAIRNHKTIRCKSRVLFASQPLLLLLLLLTAAVDARLGIRGDNTYLVVVDEDHSEEIGSLYRDITSVHRQVRVKHMYGAVLRGFALTNLSESVAAILRQDSRVQGVYQDVMIDAETGPSSPLDLGAVYARSEQTYHTYLLGSGAPDIATSWCQSFEDFSDENLPSRYHAPNSPTTLPTKSLLLHDIKVLEQQSTGYLGDLLAGLDHIAQEQVFHRNKKRIVVQLQVPVESDNLFPFEDDDGHHDHHEPQKNLWNRAIQQATAMGMALVDVSGDCTGSASLCQTIPKATMEAEAAMAHWTSLLQNTTSITSATTTTSANDPPIDQHSGKWLRSAHD